MSEQPVDILWVLISAILVALMQPGFTALEAGGTRTKNYISTAIKNMSDFLISFMVFVVFGASILLGTSYFGLVGWNPFFSYEDNLSSMVLVLFQAMFASTAVTIISGAIAERTKYSSYLIIAVIVSVFIYPIQAHWIWNENGWLAQIGFIDFAGSTVVHSVGGWAALAAILIIGPRIGRFDNDTHNFEQSNLAYSAVGVFLIWIGWIGFNGGSVLALNLQTGLVILNTLIAGSMGGIGGLIFSRTRTGYYQVNAILNGVLAGLVAITASVHFASPGSSILIGLLGYGAYHFGHTLLIKLKIDDAIEAVPVHLFAGVAGTLVVPWVMDDIDIFQQFQIQLLGVIAVGLFTFSTAYLLLKLVNRFFLLRVSETAELMGLNISEHQASTSMFDLATAMNSQAQAQDFTKRIIVEPHTDASLIANYYNQVTRAFNKLDDEKFRLIEETNRMANYDHLTGLAKRRILVAELARTTMLLERQPQKNALLFIDLDGFKNINDTYGHDAGDTILKVSAERLEACIRKSDLAARFGGDEFVILLENIQNDTVATEIADKIIQSIQQPILLDNNVQGQVGASIGLRIIDQNNTHSVDDILKLADQAMYEAKRRGKGQWVSV